MVRSIHPSRASLAAALCGLAQQLSVGDGVTPVRSHGRTLMDGRLSRVPSAALAPPAAAGAASPQRRSHMTLRNAFV